MAPLFVALGFGPLMAWKRGRIGRTGQILIPALIVALVAFGAVAWESAGNLLMTGVGLGLALWLIVSVLLEITQRLQLFT